MRKMGGLRKVMPWTFITFVIGSLSLAGVWPLAGFWSKDEILVTSFSSQPVLFYMALITVFMTAFYMFRAVFMTFGGEYRGGEVSEHSHGHAMAPHESPAVMVVPLVILSVLAVASGWFNVTGGFSQLMGHGGHGEVAHSFTAGFFGILTHSLPLMSLVVGLLGILLAYVMYSAKWLSAERIGRLFGPLHTLLSRKYYMDELYEDVLVKRSLIGGLFSGFQFFDEKGVDGTVNGVASATMAGGKTLRYTQTGQLQLYGLGMGIGVLAIALSVYFFG